MISDKRGFTLLELQMASVLMIVVLIATGVIFYFSLASIRYIHDAVMVYSNATSAMKTLSDEIMVSNCFGNSQGISFATPNYSFYGPQGYIHGIDTVTFTVPGGLGLSGVEAMNATGWMPSYGGGSAAIYLRQAPQTGAASIEGDFPSHSALCISTGLNALTGIGEMYVEVSTPGSVLAPGGGGNYTVAHHITDFSFQPIAYNCVAVSVTATGSVLDPFGADVYQVTLGKMITLRCAPTVRPWE
ncbi:MAG: type II secretion system protein [Candidatus Omnitrophota bacterium]